MRRNKALYAALAAAAVVAVACGADPEVSTGSGGPGNAAKAADGDHKPVVAAMGKPITVSADGVTASYTVSQPKIKTSGPYGIKPQNGAWLLVNYKVAVTKGEAFTCACDISLVDKSNKVYEFGVGGIDGYPDFQVTSVKAGQNGDGWVVFDLPKSAIDGSKIQLKVVSLFGDNAYGYWTVKA